MNISGLNEINHIVAVGSIDGIAGASATMRHLDKPYITIDFTQAHQVNYIDPTKWDMNRKVILIDLGVNNKDVAMTSEFVQKVHAAGHKILAIADEHDRSLWEVVMGDSFSQLIVQPKTRSEELYSTCAILRSVFSEVAGDLGKTMDEHTLELLEAGDQGDKGNFKTHFGHIFNTAVKSNMRDRLRRPYLSRYLAFNRNADAKIQSWMTEYEEIERNYPLIVSGRQDFGDGIFYYNGNAVGRHDATTLMMSQYHDGAGIVVLETNAFVKDKTGKGTLQTVVSFGTNNKNWDLLKLLDDKDIPNLGGFSQKVNVKAENAYHALEVIRALVSNSSTK